MDMAGVDLDALMTKAFLGYFSLPVLQIFCELILAVTELNGTLFYYILLALPLLDVTMKRLEFIELISFAVCENIEMDKNYLVIFYDR